MLKSVPLDIINKAAREIVEYIFKESGVHPYSMTLIEGIMDYSLVADWALAELDCAIAAEKIKHVMDYRKNHDISKLVIAKERDEEGTIIRQEVQEYNPSNESLEDWAKRVSDTVFK